MFRLGVLVILAALSANAADKVPLSVCRVGTSPTGLAVAEAVESLVRISGYYEVASDCSDKAPLRIILTFVPVTFGADRREIGAAISASFVGECVTTNDGKLIPVYSPQKVFKGMPVPYYLNTMTIFEPAEGRAHSDTALLIINGLRHEEAGD